MTSPIVTAARGAGMLARESSRVAIDRIVPDGQSLPRRASVLTPRFLEQVTGVRAGAIRSVRVIGEDSGTAGRARLAIDADLESGLPDRLFAKLPPQNLQQHLLMNVMGLGTQEVAFYRLIAPEAPIRVPRCYGTSVDVRRGRNLILLEELGGDTIIRDVRDGCSAAEAQAVIDAFADLHAVFWESPRLTAGGDLDGYGRRSATVTALGDVVLKKIITKLGPSADIVPAAIARESLVLLEREAVTSFWGSGPQTITHGDTHLGNLFFEGSSPGFLDWQVSTIGPGIRDVAYFVVASVEPALARTIERGLVDRYAERLLAAGVDVDADHLWTLYRSAVSEFYISAVAALEMGGRTQPAEIARAGVERVTAAVIALQTFEVLEDLIRRAPTHAGPA